MVVSIHDQGVSSENGVEYGVVDNVYRVGTEFPADGLAVFQ